MISIITAVHNKLDVNKFFYDFLKKNTERPYELIIIDNNSKDGSKEFFLKFADRVIPNNKNHSFPYCQNQGIKIARYDYLAFFNNDLLVSKGWDTKILNIMNKKNIDVISFATNDHTENLISRKKIQRKWKWIKYPVKSLMGINYFSLKIMISLTYADFDKFCEKIYAKFGDETVEGYSGSCILMKKSVIDKIGMWDERIQKADFDLFNRVKTRSIEKQDIKPIQLAVGVYMHHFKGLTTDFEPFADKDNLIKLDDKWGEKTKILRKDIVG
jgi:GT2 family glycosyltransferase